MSIVPRINHPEATEIIEEQTGRWKPESCQVSEMRRAYDASSYVQGLRFL